MEKKKRIFVRFPSKVKMADEKTTKEIEGCCSFSQPLRTVKQFLDDYNSDNTLKDILFFQRVGMGIKQRTPNEARTMLDQYAGLFAKINPKLQTRLLVGFTGKLLTLQHDLHYAILFYMGEQGIRRFYRAVTPGDQVYYKWLLYYHSYDVIFDAYGWYPDDEKLVKDIVPK